MKNLFTAWEEFKLGKRTTVDVQDFEFHLEDNIFHLHQELKNKTYVHASYQRFQIFDPKHRIIHKAKVRDRIVHHAIYRILAPVFESSFIYDSYSCRIGKGTHAAVDRLEGFVRKVSENYTSSCWALKCDIRKFFDSINHSVLERLIRNKINDPDTLWLVEGISRSFEVVDSFAKRERESSRNSDRESHFAAFRECLHEFV